MANFNRVILAGNLTRDPQMSFLPSNAAVVELGMAINRKWKSQSGEQREDVTYVDVRAYGKQAEVMNQYLKKGRSVLIEGQLRYDEWKGKDGKKHSKLYVAADSFQFIGGKDASGNQSDAPPGTDEPGGDNIPF